MLSIIVFRIRTFFAHLAIAIGSTMVDSEGSAVKALT